MRGKTVLVTGATAGIGFHVASALAVQGARLIITGRDHDRGRAAVEKLRIRGGNTPVDFVPADLALVSENTRLASDVATRVGRLIWPIVRWFQRRASPEAAALGPAFLASSPEATFSGRYLEGMKAASLPARVLDQAMQDRAWELGATLTERALRTGTSEAEGPR